MIQDILTLLGLTEVTEEMQSKLETIIDITSNRLKLRLGGVNAVPDALSYIVTEVSIVRFNRIGSEGLASHSVQGETMNWSDKDFDPYENDIQTWLSMQTDPSTNRGRLRFI